MFRKITRAVCGALLSGMLCCFTACSEEEETGAGYLFTYTLAGDPACLDPQYTDNENAPIVIGSIMEGLLRCDEDGNPVTAGAESYTVSDDGLHYMFNLRSDSYWYQSGMNEEEAIPVTAHDYVFAFQRMLDPATQCPHAQDFSCIRNAAAVLAGNQDSSSLGVSAPDDYTVIFELSYPNAEFLQLLTQTCAVPCNEAFFRSTNGRYGLDVETTLCNGPFYLSKWNYDSYGSDNFLSMRKNEAYYDADSIYPSSLTFTIMKSRTEADKNFTDGNSDVILTSSYHEQYMDSKDYTVEAQRAETLGLIFNPDNEILQNDKLRQALAYGIDRAALSVMLSEDLEAAYGVIPPEADLLGRSYRELYADEPLALPYDPEKASELFRQAANALQLNSTNSIRIMVSNEIRDTDALLTLCQEWQTLFGQYIGIEAVTPAEYERRLSAGEYSIALYGIHADRNSCYEVLRQFTQKKFIGFRSDQFSGLLAKIASTQHLADTVEMYGEAERMVIESHAFIPLFYKNSYLIYTSDNADIHFDGFSGVVDFREAKHFVD